MRMIGRRKGMRLFHIMISIIESRNACFVKSVKEQRNERVSVLYSIF